MAISTIGTDALASAAVTSAKLASGAPSRSQLPAGTVLQVVSTTKTDAYSTTATGATAVTGLSATITPTSSSSKIFITASVSCGGGSTGNYTMFLGLLRNSTLIGAGADGSSCYPHSGAQNFEISVALSQLDSPATTAAITYSVAAWCDNPVAVYINRSNTRGNTTSSTITVMEIAA